MMKIAIAIPHYTTTKNGNHLLQKALYSIRKYCGDQAVQNTIVLDDGSPSYLAHEAEAICKTFGVKIIRSLVNCGVSHQFNQAIRIAERSGYDAVVLMNNDIELLMNPIAAFKRIFFEDKDISAIGGLLLYPSGRVQHEGVMVNSAKSIFLSGRESPFPTHPAAYVTCVTAALMAIRIESSPAFRPYPLSYQDVHFCLDLWSQGKRVFYTPEVIAVHHESATRGTTVNPKEYESLMMWLKSELRIEEIGLQLARARSPHAAAWSQPFLQALAHSSLAQQTLGRIYTPPTTQD